MSNRMDGVHPRILNVVIGVVVTAWVASLVLDATGVWVDPPETIGLAFMALLGPLVGVWAARVAASSTPPEGVERRAADRLDHPEETSSRE